MARLLETLTPLEALMDEAELDVLEVCASMSGRLQVSPVPDSIEGCRVLETRLRERVEDLFPLGVPVGLVQEPARCFVSVQLARACAASCGGEPAEVRCEGELVGACEGTCRGVCQGTCEGVSCRGECSDFCTGTCDGQCFGECEGECSHTDRCGNCITACDGSCERGVCRGVCEGECSGVCTSSCDAACEGVCVGECEGDFEASCHGVVAVDHEVCGLACTIESALSADCPVPEVRARGPELFDPRNHALADQAVLIASTTLERGLAPRERLRTTIDPWLSTLRRELEEAAELDDGACLSDGATRVRALEARLTAMLELLDQITLALETAIGTNLDE